MLVCDALEAGFPIIYASASFERLTQFSPEEVLGRSCRLLQGPDTDPLHIATMAQALRSGEECRVVVLNYRKDGAPFWNEVFLSPVIDAGGTIVSYVGVQHDVSGRVAHEAELTRMALHDALTGLPNRRLLDDRTRMALERSARDGGAVALLMLDLDHFKRVNDTLGHAAGDILLCRVASRLDHALRSTDTVARLGGDEFAVLCGPDLSSSVQAVADRVLSVFAEPFELGAHRLPVTSSVGIAVSRRGSATVETLLRDADVAMYRAKRRGQGLVEFFDPSASTHDISVERLELEVDLHRALEDGALHVEYQPKVDLGTGDVRFVEALVRWDHPERGRVPPGAFIPIAESTGLIKRIGAYVLETACRDAAAWRRRFGDPLGFCVNLSAAELVADDLLTSVERALDSSGVSPGQIGFEWTESGVLIDRAGGIQNLRALHRLGCHLAIDDFGTGYASLAHLQDVPAGELKMDRSFVATAEDQTNGRGAALRSAIIALARGFELVSTAEGIETRAQLNVLRGLGCDQGQGFLLARPGRFEALPHAIEQARDVVRGAPAQP